MILLPNDSLTRFLFSLSPSSLSDDSVIQWFTYQIPVFPRLGDRPGLPSEFLNWYPSPLIPSQLGLPPEFLSWYPSPLIPSQLGLPPEFLSWYPSLTDFLLVSLSPELSTIWVAAWVGSYPWVAIFGCPLSWLIPSPPFFPILPNASA